MLFDPDAIPYDARASYLESLKPRPPGEPPRWPRANVIKRGEAGEFPRVPEDPALLIGREQECFLGLRPSDGFQAWLVGQASLTTIKMDRCGRIERRLRDLAVMEVELHWSDQRAERARALGARLAQDPASVAVQLRSDFHGCEWLIDRWARLALAAQDGETWGAEQVRQAHDLLGTPPDARQERPGYEVVYEKGRASVRSPEPCELAHRQIVGLRRRKARLIHLDAIGRAMFESDLTIEPTPALRELGRYEAGLRSWLRWLVKQARLDPPDRLSPAEYYPELPQAQPESKPEAPAQPEPRPEPAAPAAAEASEPPGEEETKPAEARPKLPRVAAGTRKSPRAIRDEARRDAKLRKRERRLA